MGGRAVGSRDRWMTRCRAWQWTVHQSKERTGGLLLCWCLVSWVIARLGKHHWALDSSVSVLPTRRDIKNY
jgi:hypothetical protein